MLFSLWIHVSVIQSQLRCPLAALLPFSQPLSPLVEHLGPELDDTLQHALMSVRLLMLRAVMERIVWPEGVVHSPWAPPSRKCVTDRQPHTRKAARLVSDSTSAATMTFTPVLRFGLVLIHSLGMRFS